VGSIRCRGRARRLLPLGLSAVVALAAGAPARAATPTIQAAAAPPAAGLRLVPIDVVLAREERRFVIWRWTWTATYAAFALGSIAALPLVDRESRIDFYTGAVTSTLAIVPTLLFRQPSPPAPSYGSPGDDDAAGRLRLAEARAIEIAAYQRAARGPAAHIVNLAFNAAVSLFLGLGFDRWPSAGLNFVGGTILGEAQIYTHPSSVGATLPAVAER
jgi:hypothetical protein